MADKDRKSLPGSEANPIGGSDRIKELEDQIDEIRRRNASVSYDLLTGGNMRADEVKKVLDEIAIVMSLFGEDNDRAVMAITWVRAAIKPLVERLNGLDQIGKGIDKRCALGGDYGCIASLPAYESKEPGSKEEGRFCEACKTSRVDMVEFLIECSIKPEGAKQRKIAWDRYLQSRDQSKVCENEKSRYKTIRLRYDKYPDKCEELTEGERFCGRCKRGAEVEGIDISEL
jgi:hypothetical protein